MPRQGGVPSIYSIVPPNDGSALRHGHHFEPVDFVIDHGRGHHDAYSAGSCQRTYARARGCRQRPRCHREELIESERVASPSLKEEPFEQLRIREVREAFLVIDRISECEGQSGISAREFGDHAGVDLAQCWMSSQDEGVGDLRPLRIDTDDRSYLCPVLADVILNCNQADVRCRRSPEPQGGCVFRSDSCPEQEWPGAPRW